MAGKQGVAELVVVPTSALVLAVVVVVVVNWQSRLRLIVPTLVSVEPVVVVVVVNWESRLRLPRRVVLRLRHHRCPRRHLRRHRRCPHRRDVRGKSYDCPAGFLLGYAHFMLGGRYTFRLSCIC